MGKIKIIIFIFVVSFGSTYAMGDFNMNKVNKTIYDSGKKMDSINNTEVYKSKGGSFIYNRKQIDIKMAEMKSEMGKKMTTFKETFKEKQKKIIKDYKKGNKTLKDAKKEILYEKQKIIKVGKKELFKQKENIKKQRLNILKQSIKEKITKKLEKFSEISKVKKNILYGKVIKKINSKLLDTNLSRKKRLLYNLLKDIFNDLII